ncbi:MAG: hypothetical protein A2156_14500 [Deltaproteobacteria bacterium RBG_16_48_10]|nr:MAG: hypothetical protein A2156_14500 [Deltaproteobacteria bacterium RBG_16_48_10]
MPAKLGGREIFQTLSVEFDAAEIRQTVSGELDYAIDQTASGQLILFMVKGSRPPTLFDSELKILATIKNTLKTSQPKE